MLNSKPPHNRSLPPREETKGTEALLKLQYKYLILMVIDAKFTNKPGINIDLIILTCQLQFEDAEIFSFGVLSLHRNVVKQRAYFISRPSVVVCLLFCSYGIPLHVSVCFVKLTFITATPNTCLKGAVSPRFSATANSNEGVAINWNNSCLVLHR